MQEMVEATLEDPAVGVKTRFVMNLLEGLQQRQGGEKTLIFCSNLDPLMLLERMLETQFGWVGGQETLRIDGNFNADERQSIIDRFNDPHGVTRVLLLSTKACGEGVTLTGASRVVFMDVVWNPAVLRQAIHRAFRIGQTKVVHVYSLLVAGNLILEHKKPLFQVALVFGYLCSGDKILLLISRLGVQRSFVCSVGSYDMAT